MTNTALEWRHHECDAASNHRRLGCVLNRLFRDRSKKTSKIRLTGLCDGKSPVTGEFPIQKKAVTRKMLPSDYVIMVRLYESLPCIWLLNIQNAYSPNRPRVYFYCQISIMIRTWINSHVHFVMLDVTTHQRPYFNGGLTRWVITAPYFERM